MKFNKNLFLVNDNNMHPYVSKGDVAVYEPMQMKRRIASSVYIIKYNGIQMIARVQLLVRGGMNLLFDGDRRKLIELKQGEREQVIFKGSFGHVTGKDGELIEGYSLYS